MPDDAGPKMNLDAHPWMSSTGDVLLFFALCDILVPGPDRWCTVTVVDPEGRRHSLDLQASSLYDAAHIYVCHVKEHPERGHPRPTLATVFEVAIDAKVYRVDGKALQRWIVKRRSELNGPKGMRFSQRPMLE